MKIVFKKGTFFSEFGLFKQFEMKDSTNTVIVQPYLNSVVLFYPPAFVTVRPLLFVLLVEVGVLPPRFEVVPELVEPVQNLARRRVRSKPGHWVARGPSPVGLENRAKCLKSRQNYGSKTGKMKF